MSVETLSLPHLPPPCMLQVPAIKIRLSLKDLVLSFHRHVLFPYVQCHLLCGLSAHTPLHPICHLPLPGTDDICLALYMYTTMSLALYLSLGEPGGPCSSILLDTASQMSPTPMAASLAQFASCLCLRGSLAVS